MLHSTSSVIHLACHFSNLLSLSYQTFLVSSKPLQISLSTSFTEERSCLLNSLIYCSPASPSHADLLLTLTSYHSNLCPLPHPGLEHPIPLQTELSHQRACHSPSCSLHLTPPLSHTDPCEGSRAALAMPVTATKALPAPSHPDCHCLSCVLHAHV